MELFARSQGWMNWNHQHDYNYSTIIEGKQSHAAPLFGPLLGGKLPDDI